MKFPCSTLLNTCGGLDGMTRPLEFNGHPPIERSLFVTGHTRILSCQLGMRSMYLQPTNIKMQIISSLKNKAPLSVVDLLKRSRFLTWSYGLMLRNNWREIHSRDSCVYGFVNLASILLDLIQTGPARVRVTAEVYGVWSQPSHPFLA